MPDGEKYDSSEESGLLYSQYIFQLTFAATAATIVSGAIAMRMKIGVYCFFAAYSVQIYSFMAHWIWAGDRWLKAMGVFDFVGGGPVHILGGTNALVAVLFVGPKRGFFRRRDRTDFAPSSPASKLFGLFMWGWIGFNCGSTFGITGERWIVATRAAIVTVNTSAGGGVVSLIYTLQKTKGKHIKVHHLVNGILGALVASSATCAVVHAWEALVIGAVGALIANLLNTLMKRWKIDDPIGAVGIHVFSGIWGYIAVGLFADSELPGVKVSNGLFRGGGGRLLGLQMLAIISIVAWSLVTTIPFFYITGVCLSKDCKGPRSGLRISMYRELQGEDRCLHGIDDPLDPSIRLSKYGSGAFAFEDYDEDESFPNALQNEPGMRRRNSKKFNDKWIT
ncbi:hypothetical protein ACHAWF_011858 [Thalassiosira exigua]